MSQLRIGLVGAGAMGLYHARNIPQGRACINGVFEPDEKRRAEIASIRGSETRFFSTPHDLITDSEIDAVLVCSPDAAHAECVLECLSAKKTVLCEKPLAASLEDLEKIITTESAGQKKYISVGFNRRFDPAHSELFQKVWSGEIGTPLLWKGTHRNAASFYNNQGAFILANSAGHDIDSARWLLKSEVKTVSVKGLKSRDELPADACDCLLLRLEMRTGALAFAEVYVNCEYGYEVIAEVVCQKGTVITADDGLSVCRSRANRSVYIPDDFRAYFADAYAKETGTWIESIIDNKAFPGADAWDGYAAAVAAFACGASLLENKDIDVAMIPKPVLYERYSETI